MRDAPESARGGRERRHLDALTGGRFVLGAGLGDRNGENAAFDLPGASRPERSERLDVIRRLLEGKQMKATGTRTG